MIRFRLINVFLALCQIALKNMKCAYQIIGWWCFWFFTPELFMLHASVLNLLPLLFFYIRKISRAFTSFLNMRFAFICTATATPKARAHWSRWKKKVENAFRCSHAFIKRPLYAFLPRAEQFLVKSLLAKTKKEQQHKNNKHHNKVVLLVKNGKSEIHRQ